MSATKTSYVDYQDLLVNPDQKISEILLRDGTTYDLSREPSNELEELSLVALAHMYADKKNSNNIKSILRYWKYLDARKNIRHTSLDSVLVTHRTRSENIFIVCGNTHDVLHATHMPSNEKFYLQKKLNSIMKENNKIISVSYGNQFESNISKHNVPELIYLGSFSIPLYMQIKKNILPAKIISKDSLHTCRAVAHAAGIHASQDACLTGLELEAMTDTELLDILPRINIFSELTDMNKERLIRIIESTYGNNAKYRS